MPLGICMKCDKLCPIVRVGLHPLSREAVWRPLVHDKVPRHKTCGIRSTSPRKGLRDG